MAQDLSKIPSDQHIASSALAVEEGYLHCEEHLREVTNNPLEDRTFAAAVEVIIDERITEALNKSPTPNQVCLTAEKIRALVT